MILYCTGKVWNNKKAVILSQAIRLWHHCLSQQREPLLHTNKQLLLPTSFLEYVGALFTVKCKWYIFVCLLVSPTYTPYQTTFYNHRFICRRVFPAVQTRSVTKRYHSMMKMPSASPLSSPPRQPPPYSRWLSPQQWPPYQFTFIYKCLIFYSTRKIL